MDSSVLNEDGPSSWILEDNNWLGTGIALAHNGIQFILENLDWFLDHTSVPEHQNSIKLLYDNLKFSRSFLEKVQKINCSFTQEDLKRLVDDLLKVVKLLLDVTDSCVQSNIMEKNTPSSILATHIDRYNSEIDSLVRQIETSQLGTVENASGESGSFPSPEHSTIWNNSTSTTIEEDQTMIGFDNERRELLDKLIGPVKQQQVISITGMGGIGKTTLAQSLFTDPQVVNRFHERAWTFLSQHNDKRKSLHNILSNIIDPKDSVFNDVDDENMGAKLYKSLKGKTYLIVIDGIWDIRQWNDIKMYFPEDQTGSRILLTSRNRDVALKIAPGIPPHTLPFLNVDESWDLFKRKVFPENNHDVPEELSKLGKHIVESCHGLPLAICVIAGILFKEEKSEEHWRSFAENIGRIRRVLPSSSNFAEKFDYMDVLELSYNHLSPMLQSCFLYLGTYSDDHSIPSRRLALSWIAEGLIQWETTDKRLEDIDVAENRLKELVDRSLVIVVDKRSDGGIKSCRIHDLLRDLCHKKVEEKKFLQPICHCSAVDNRPGNFPNGRRLRIFFETTRPDFVRPFHRCSPCFHFYKSPFYAPIHDVFHEKSLPVYRFLRRLELKNVVLLNLPEQISTLFHLRYLELQVDRITSRLSVFQLWNLETCILHVEKGGRVEVPREFWKMLKLRHLQISLELHFSDDLQFSGSSARVLENLQTISRLDPSGSVDNVLARTPNLRKLCLHRSLSDSIEHFDFPNLSHLGLLQKLKFEYQTLGCAPVIIDQLHLHKFPPSLKKLTLIGSHLQWEEISIISMLPNLEILKLKDNFFSGPLWETSDDGFRGLKFLKLSHMDIRKWISSSDHFPRLEHLVLNGCLNLEELPLEFGDMDTLKTIKVYHSSKSAADSANQILESQSNDDLKVFIYRQFEEY